jgi:hypothetical protein
MSTRGRTTERRTVAALWAGAAVALAGLVLLLAHLVPRIQAGLATQEWTPTEGVLLYAAEESEFVPDADESTVRYWLSLCYAYSAPDPVSGEMRDHSGRHFDIDTSSGKEDGRTPASNGMARAAAADAPRVTVYYDPADPKRSVLRRGISYGASFFCIPLVALLGLGLGLARMAFVGRTIDGETDKPSQDGLQLMIWALFLPLGSSVAVLALTMVLAPAFDNVPSPWWAIGFSMVALLLWRIPDLLRVRPVAGLAGVVALATPVLLTAGLGMRLWQEETEQPLPAYEPSSADLIAYLEHPNSVVREFAAWAVGHTEEPGLDPELVARLVGDLVVDVADAGIYIVKQCRLRHPAIRDAMVTRLTDPSAELRHSAAWNLGAQDDPSTPESRTGAFALLEGGETSQRAGLTLLVTIGRERQDAAAAVARLVVDPECPTRRQAIYTLECIRADHPVAQDAVLAVLAEGDETLRRTAIHYLGEVARSVEVVPPAALAAIVEDLRHADVRRRRYAARALQRLGPAAAPALDALDSCSSTDDDALTRHLAAEAITMATAARARPR